MVTAQRKLAIDKPACLPIGSSLERVWPVPLVIVVSTSRISTRGAKCSMLAMSMGYVTYAHVRSLTTPGHWYVLGFSFLQ